MSSLLYVKIRKDARFKWSFLSRRSHVDYVREISYAIMDRYSKRYNLFNDKAKEIVLRVSRDISGDPVRTMEAITQYFGYGRYVNNEWEIDSYNYNPLKNADRYTRLIDGYEVDLNKGRLSEQQALIEADIDYKHIFNRYPVGWVNICGVCCKKGSYSHINFKDDLYGWYLDKKYSGGFYESTRKATLCTSCWNKLKAVLKKENEAKEIKRLSNKLNRERLKWLKSQTQAN